MHHFDGSFPCPSFHADITINYKFIHQGRYPPSTHRKIINNPRGITNTNMKKTKATKATKHCISHSLAMQMVLMLAMHTVILLSVGPITNVVSASEHAPSSTEKSKRSTKDHDHDMLEMDNRKGSYRNFDQDRSGKEPPSLDLMEDSFTFSSLRGSERTVGKEEDNVKHEDSEKSNRLTMHKVDIAKDAVNYIEHYLPSQEESESTPPSSEPGLGVELGERVGFVRRKSSSASISLTPRQVIDPSVNTNKP